MTAATPSGALGRFWRGDPLSGVALALLLLLLFLGIFGGLLPLGDPMRLGAGPRLGDDRSLRHLGAFS